ncbi:M15 family metallopeptidase [Candidatus Giovannonibacteria bacterium]|nr:M15 family metallopeptidase [Candidatus Giovannonibacteria bacterium]
MTFDEAVFGKEIPDEILNELELISVPFWSFEEKICRGELVVNKKIAAEIAEIFQKICDSPVSGRFPIEKIIPISKYDWDDASSMEDNNTSCFNYRLIYKTNRLSNHAKGLAVDINPALNPYIAMDESVWPKGASYNTNHPGTILADGLVVKIFESYGWSWGGKWQDRKDWQHFEKVL